MRAALLASFALFAVSAAFAGSAKAADVPLTFDGAAADIGPLIKGADVFCDDPDRASPVCPKTMTVTPDVTGSTVTIEPGDFVFPTWKTQLGDPPSNLDIAVSLTSNATGTYDGVTGALAMNPAPFTISVNGACVSAGNMWAFTTENGPPGQTPEPDELLGDRFDALSSPPANGAIVALWDSINTFPDPNPATAANECGQLNLAASGPGGLWFGKGLMRNFARQPTPPATDPGTPPATKKCKKGQKLKKGKCVKKKKKKKKK